MTNDRRKSWYVVVRHHAKVPTTSYIEWQPNSGIKCIFQQLSWTSTYSTKYQNFVQKPICSTDNPPLTRFPLTRYPLMWFSKKQIFSFSQMSVWDFVFLSQILAHSRELSFWLFTEDSTFLWFFDSLFKKFLNRTDACYNFHSW